MKRSLIVTVSALILAAHMGGPAAAHFKTRQLLEIETLINEGHWTDLRRYISANPELLQGDDALALELAQFMEASKGIIAFLSFDNIPMPDLSKVDASAAIY